MSKPDKSSAQGAYLVVVSDYIVSQDLAETVADFVPDAKVIVRPTIGDALQALERVERVAVAFVGDRPARFANSPLAAMIHAKGGRVVLLGDEAEVEGPAEGWAVLQRPFSLSLVQTLLASSISV